MKILVDLLVDLFKKIYYNNFTQKMLDFGDGDVMFFKNNKISSMVLLGSLATSSASLAAQNCATADFYTAGKSFITELSETFFDTIADRHGVLVCFFMVLATSLLFLSCVSLILFVIEDILISLFGISPINFLTNCYKKFKETIDLREYKKYLQMRTEKGISSPAPTFGEYLEYKNAILLRGERFYSEDLLFNEKYKIEWGGYQLYLNRSRKFFNTHVVKFDDYRRCLAILRNNGIQDTSSVDINRREELILSLGDESSIEENLENEKNGYGVFKDVSRFKEGELTRAHNYGNEQCISLKLKQSQYPGGFSNVNIVSGNDVKLYKKMLNNKETKNVAKKLFKRYVKELIKANIRNKCAELDFERFCKTAAKIINCDVTKDAFLGLDEEELGKVVSFFTSARDTKIEKVSSEDDKKLYEKMKNFVNRPECMKILWADYIEYRNLYGVKYSFAEFCYSVFYGIEYRRLKTKFSDKEIENMRDFFDQFAKQDKNVDPDDKKKKKKMIESEEAKDWDYVKRRANLLFYLYVIDLNICGRRYSFRDFCYKIIEGDNYWNFDSYAREVLKKFLNAEKAQLVPKEENSNDDIEGGCFSYYIGQEKTSENSKGIQNAVISEEMENVKQNIIKDSTDKTRKFVRYEVYSPEEKEKTSKDAENTLNGIILDSANQINDKC